MRCTLRALSELVPFTFPSWLVASFSMIPSDHDDLALPPLDGEGDAEGPDVHEELDDAFAGGDALDDATSENDPLEEIHVDGAEGGWLTDSDDAHTLDVGAFDLGGAAEGKILGDDEPEALAADEDLGGTDAEHGIVDGGEEGPLADDEELREEDLPSLDADEEGDVSDTDLFDRSVIASSETEELRWDDRAWTKVDGSLENGEEIDDSGTLAVPADDPSGNARDAMWKRLEETGRVTAAAFVPGESVVVALMSPDHGRALLVRIQPDGAALIIAEISEDEPRIAQLRWDPSRGRLVASGAFGTFSFRPTL
jgi:hypothetical protein